MGLKLYGNFYEERLRMRDQAKDPAVKAHFQAELDLIKKMNEASDIQDPPATGAVNPPDAKKNFRQPDGDPQSSPSSPPSTPPSAPPTATGTDPSIAGKDNDSNKKVQTLMPMFEKLSKETGVPANTLAAVMVQESRGYSIESMKNAGGLMQLGPNEFKYLQDKNPELLGGMTHLSTEGQVTSAALYLKELKGNGTWDDALFKYNHGPNAGNNPAFGDPHYMTSIHEHLRKIENGESLPS
ncbi:transglycosylase SLT domain-containing protein [Noviherbaspirillum aerium]|uniref:transglycosylase SLT domain-containing protein n=1 Tax=Noviherbaspirillum aerium TaxID=2588497 RepID=UPI00124DA355|nr:transglycosylase SLT domain-containing protein [Noviherbaspirillum aerium]